LLHGVAATKQILEFNAMKSFLAPTNDVVFKLLFSKSDNSELLISFLTAVLQPKSPILSATILNPELTKGASNDKSIVLDVAVQLSDKSKVDVEMQVANRKNLRKRIPYYLARLHQNQLEIGDDYVNITPSACIVVLAYNETDEENFHTIYELREQSSNTLFSDDLRIHLIELLKVSKYLQDHPVKKNQDVIYWTRFFNSKSNEELETLAMERPIFEKANQALQFISNDPSAKQMIEDRAKAVANFSTAIDASREEGKQEGRQEGRQEGAEKTRHEIVVNMHAEGMNPHQIAKLLKIDVHLIEKIINQI
jgi:predicted transposase/invertase (TIGR01784 family)